MGALVASLWDNLQSGLGLAALISIAVIVMLLLVLLTGEYVLTYRLLRKSGSLKPSRALAVSLRYAFVFRFGISGYGLCVEDLKKKESRGELVIPEGVASIGKSAFEACRFTSVRLPSSLKSIGERSFERCCITDISIPSGVQTIGESAFCFCSALKTVDMPFVPDMSFSAFRWCDELKSVTVSGQRLDMSAYGGNGFNAFLWYLNAMKLAGEGNTEALCYAARYSAEMLELFVSQGSIVNLERLLSLPCELPAVNIDNAIEAAVKYERREMYVMLVQYKRGRAGFETDVEKERFKL